MSLIINAEAVKFWLQNTTKKRKEKEKNTIAIIHASPHSTCSLCHIQLFAVIKEHGTCKHQTIPNEKQMSWNYHLELFPQSFLSIKASCLESYWAWSHKWIAFEVQRMLKHQTLISLFIYLVYLVADCSIFSGALIPFLLEPKTFRLEYCPLERAIVV